MTSTPGIPDIFADRGASQFISNDSGQHGAAIDGLGEIATVIKQYTVVESIYFRRADITLQKEVLDAVSTLYYNILEYQAKAACHFARKTGFRTVRNIFKIDKWDELLAGVKASDDSCRKFLHIFDSVDYREGMNSIEKQLADQAPKVREILETVRKLHSLAEGSEKKPATSKPCFMVPFYKDKDFVSRDDQIRSIQDIFEAHRRVALVGLGGVG